MRLSISHVPSRLFLIYLDQEARDFLGPVVSLRVFERSDNPWMVLWPSPPGYSTSGKNSQARQVHLTRADHQVQITDRALKGRELLGNSFFGKTDMSDLVVVGTSLEARIPAEGDRRDPVFRGRYKAVTVPDAEPTAVAPPAPPPLALPRKQFVVRQTGRGFSLMDGDVQVLQGPTIEKIMTATRSFGIQDEDVTLPRAAAPTGSAASMVDIIEELTRRGVRTKLTPGGSLITFPEKK